MAHQDAHCTKGVFVSSEAYSGLLRGARVISVDPAACIPLAKFRDIVKSGVNRLKQSYALNESSSISTGATAGGFLPTVVELKGVLLNNVKDYLINECSMGEREAQECFNSRNQWYGIIDGAHRWSALLDLREENPDQWFGFQWSVLVLRGGYPLDVLRAFARVQNLKQSDQIYVETTLYDLLKGLQEEARRLSVRNGGRKPTGKELAESFSACKERTSSATRQLANLSLRISEYVLNAIGKIMNMECPRLASTYYLIRGKGDLNPDTISDTWDCRVFRNFITLSSLRQATLFMQPNDDYSDEIRVFTLYRVQEICRNTGYKPVPFRYVNEQFVKAKAAFREAKKFETLLQATKWPQGMEKLRNNLLKTSILDDEVESNSGNDNDILRTLLIHLRRCCPERAPLMEARYTDFASRSRPELIEGEVVVNDKDKDVTLDNTEARNDVTFQGCEANKASSGEELAGKELRKTSTPTEHEKGLQLLKQLGICSFQMRWQDYNRTLYSTTDKLFDMILTEPPRGVKSSGSMRAISVDDIDEKEMVDFANFAGRVLVPGGYVFLFTQAKHFRDWVRVFRANDFLCVDYPFVIVKNAVGVQRTNQLIFPQEICDIAVMAVNPGRHPKGFKPDFTSTYSIIPCTYKRKFAAIDKAEVVRKKLRFDGSRAFVRKEEKNPDILAEIMETFSPTGGRILDPYAGTMPVAIACMESERTCVVIEEDEECFKLAQDRLCKLTPLYAGSPTQRQLTLMSKVRNEIQSDTSSGSSDSASRSGMNAAGEDNASDGVVAQNGQRAKNKTTNSTEKSIEKEHCPPTHSKKGLSSSPATSSVTPEKVVKQSIRSICEEDIGKPVLLLVGGEVVGSAEIQRDYSASENGFRTELHGEPLKRFERDDEDLVVVWRCEIKENCENYCYPYRHGGIEEPVSKLGDMRGGFHAWDLHSMTLATEQNVLLAKDA